MGVGAMMAGGNPANGREKDDFYPTPWQVTRALVQEIGFDSLKVLEPAAGNYAMAAEIERAGYQVEALDINPRDDRVKQGNFFDLKATDAKTIITNPPFNLARKFIEHSFDVLKVSNLALLLKSTFWHASTRSDLFERYPPTHVCALTWRPDFMSKGNPTMDCCWFVWTDNNDDRVTEYRLLKKPEETQ